MFFPFILFVCFSSFVYAEEVPFAFDRTKPIKMSSQTLEVDDLKATGTFIGKVHIQQGKFQLFADNVTLFYNKKNRTTGDNLITNGLIQKITAKGNITLLTHSPEENKATANRLDYVLKDNLITLQEDVVLSRDNNIIHADIIKIQTDTQKITLLSHPKKSVESIIYISDPV